MVDFFCGYMFIQVVLEPLTLQLTWQWKLGKGQIILQMPMKKSEGKAGGIRK